MSHSHHHHYATGGEARAETKTRTVLAITLAVMVLELVAGYWSGSMALTADGWHMGSHAVALGVSAFAYAFARKHAHNARFTFGTGKVGSLAGFASALLLGVVALEMTVSCIERLLSPRPIQFGEALVVAVFGLAVNLGCAWLLGEHGDKRHHSHQDHNLKSAYLHVLADALTSVGAIAALGLGWRYGWLWLDAAVGLAGAALIAVWATGLIMSTGAVLLDAEDLAWLEAEIRLRLKQRLDLDIEDLHVWRIGAEHFACIIAVEAQHEAGAHERVRQELRNLSQLAHVTVEVHDAPA
ncbi:MAG: CDF family Co(II)/Ni(II) efflux transporter DmeF [Gammaproteobacteria bacterium]|nr:CDF family Co(II)/Ni(II) efflux transporter DmeF [Gammaproteobacteria bacterium]